MIEATTRTGHLALATGKPSSKGAVGLTWDAQAARRERRRHGSCQSDHVRKTHIGRGLHRLSVHIRDELAASGIEARVDPERIYLDVDDADEDHMEEGGNG